MGDVTWETTPNGSLLVTWDAEARMAELAWETFEAYGLTAFLLEPEEIESAGVSLALQNSPYDAFVDLMEPLVANDSYQWLTALEAGVLTDGPLLAYGIVTYAQRWDEQVENGEVIPESEFDAHAPDDIFLIGSLYYYNDYQIRSPMTDLLVYGQVTFNLDK